MGLTVKMASSTIVGMVPEAMRDGPIAFWLAVSFLLILSLYGVYDLIAVFSEGRIMTVSHFLQQWSSKWAIIPFGIGVLMGHLFFPG